MTSIRMKLRSSSVEGKEGTLYYQVIHKRITRLVKTTYHLYDYEWNGKTDSLIIDNRPGRCSSLLLIRDMTNWEMHQLHAVVTRLENSGTEFLCDDIVREFQQSPRVESVFAFMQRQIKLLTQENRIRTARGFQTSMNHFQKFRNGEDLSFEAFDSDLMKSFESHLKSEGVVKNSSANYMRVWRNVYNHAVEKGYTLDKKPFRHIYTSIDKTRKRAIPVRYIKAMQQLDLAFSPKLNFARDLFLFSFCTRGMSYVDIAYLKADNIRYGKLTYNRRKTGQQLHIQWERPMQNIVDRYKTSSIDGYLFPIFQNKGRTETQELDYRYTQINRSLKKIATLIGLDIPLTLYVARHSWASIAKLENIPTTVISKGLGHNSEKTTQIYLAELDSSLVDTANLKILDLLRPR